MSKHLTFILGFVLAAAVTSAAVVTYGIKSNGVTLPARPVLSFSGATSCVDDPANNATSCVTDAGSSGPTFWYDGGPGFIIANEILGTSNAVTPVTMSRTVISPGLTNQGPVLTLQAQVATASQPTISANTTYNVGLGGGRYSEIQFGFNGEPETQFGNYYQLSTDTHVAGVCANSGQSPSGDRIGFVVKTPGGNRCDEGDFATSSSTLRMDIDSTKIRALITLQSTVASATDAFKVNNNGARIDLGAGASDYAVSDGTGIETPSYWESTRTLTTGPGLIASATTLTSNSTLSFDSTLSSTYAAGSIATDDIRGTVIRRLASTGTSAFAPVAQHIVFDEQTFTTRIIGKELNAPPKFAEFVAQSAPGNLYLDMYWTDADNATQVLGTRLWYYIETTAVANNQQYGTSTASTQGTFDGTAFTRMTSSDLSPSMCQRVYTGADMTDTRIWVGLGAGTLAAATSTMSQNGVFFRYDSSVPDTAWQFCTKDGTTQSCANTTVTVTAATEYTLCAKLDDTRAAYAYINGNIVGRKTSNRVPADTVLGPFISVETLTAATKRLNVGVMQIGTR